MSGPMAPMSDRQTVRRLHLRVVAAVTVVVTFVVGLSAAAIQYAERGAPGTNIRSYWDAVWWAMETITTVGYGDHHPTTTGGQVIAMGVMVIGVALVGVITATVVTWFFSELDLLRDVRGMEQAEEKTEATLEEVLVALVSIRERLESIEGADAKGGQTEPAEVATRAR